MENINTLKNYFDSYERVATLPLVKNSVMFKNWIPAEKTLVMFGSEADGLSDELKEYSTVNLTVEMNNNVESLNLSISAGIIMHKLGM